MVRNAIDELIDLDRPFGRLFGDLVDFPLFYRRWPAASAKPFIPTADVFARNGDLVLRVELPGIDPAKDVTVTVEDGQLTVKGERHEEQEIKEDGYYRKESSYGVFERHLPIPKGVTESQIKATYTDGVLEVVVPGATKAVSAPKPKVIPVKSTPKTKS